MRICYLCVEAFVHVRPYIDYFTKAGHEVHFVALSPGRPRKWRYPFDMVSARRRIRALKPDVLHAHYATSGGLAALASGYHPSIVTVHGTDLNAGSKSRVWRPILKRIFRRVDLVNPVSDDLKTMALTLGADPRKTVVLTLGIDSARFSAPARPPWDGVRTLKLVCTRHLEPLYDPTTIVEALSILKMGAVDFRMTFCAGGSLRPALEAECAKRGLSERVAFLGGVPNDRIPALLADNDVYLSASRWDGTSLSLLEAMAAGLYPVVSDIPANASWLERGKGGSLHRAGDAADLAAGVLGLMQHPDAGPRAAALNRARVAADGDRPKNMARLEELYKKLAAGR